MKQTRRTSFGRSFQLSVRSSAHITIHPTAEGHISTMAKQMRSTVSHMPARQFTARSRPSDSASSLVVSFVLRPLRDGARGVEFRRLSTSFRRVRSARTRTRASRTAAERDRRRRDGRSASPASATLSPPTLVADVASCAPPRERRRRAFAESNVCRRTVTTAAARFCRRRTDAVAPRKERRAKRETRLPERKERDLPTGRRRFENLAANAEKPTEEYRRPRGYHFAHVAITNGNAQKLLQLRRSGVTPEVDRWGM